MKIERPAWIVALVVLGLIWFRAHDAKVAADALAEARGDSLEAALDSVETVRNRLAAADSALEIHEAQDRAHAQADRQRERIARAQADSTAATLDSVIASLPDTTPLVIAITNEREAGAACRVSLSSCEALNGTLTERVAVLDSTVTVLVPALERTRQILVETERRLKPRPRIGPCVGAGAAAGVEGTVRLAGFAGLCLSYR